MQLTLLLLKRKFPRGNIFLGKYRLVKKVEPIHIANTRVDLQREEENMLYLRYPYISKKEYHGMGNVLGTTEKFFAKWEKQKIEHFKRTVEKRTLNNRINRLAIDDRWE